LAMALPRLERRDSTIWWHEYGRHGRARLSKPPLWRPLGFSLL